MENGIPLRDAVFISALVLALLGAVILAVLALVAVLILVLIAVLVLIVHCLFLHKFFAVGRFGSLPKSLGFILCFEDQTCH